MVWQLGSISALPNCRPTLIGYNMNEDAQKLSYASGYSAKRPIRFLGAISLGLCVFEIPWAIGVAWGSWTFVWGDNQPPILEFVLGYLVGALPCLIAIGLGC